MKEILEKPLELLSFAETCSLLKISKGLLRAVDIPHVRIRRRVLFRRSDIEKFIEENMRGIKK
jgi:excisionase family DNA binding protein